MKDASEDHEEDDDNDYFTGNDPPILNTGGIKTAAPSHAHSRIANNNIDAYVDPNRTGYKEKSRPPAIRVLKKKKSNVIDHVQHALTNN